MPSLEQAITARVIDQESEAAEKAAIEQAQRDAPDAAKLDRLERLAQNDEFRWFVETYLAPMEAKEKIEALDINRTPDQRNNSAHRWDLAKSVLDIVDRERTRLTNKLFPK